MAQTTNDKQQRVLHTFLTLFSFVFLVLLSFVSFSHGKILALRRSIAQSENYRNFNVR